MYDEEREWQKSKMKRSLLLAEKRDNLRTSVGMNQERKQYRFNSTHPALEGSTSVSCRGVGGEIFTKKKGGKGRHTLAKSSRSYNSRYSQRLNTRYDWLDLLESDLGKEEKGWSSWTQDFWTGGPGSENHLSGCDMFS